ncbi:EAL domain-containing response regulator [Pararhizobium sp. O133]|uniref:EAL domain-containing response regulator n=1 Tax=Pararhizobium sp. O133 TaxID=3449278 RepID=UPI003F683034
MLHQLNCLIVDDDPMYVMVADSILSSLTSGSVSKASNGSLGLEALRAGGSKLDVVLLDLNMPDIDGLGFMRAASEVGFDGNIIISSGETPAVLRSAEAMGKMLGISVLGALPKPLKIDAVAAALQEASRRGRRSSLRLVGNIVRDDFELTPYYQPQYSLHSRKIVGLESLVRLTAKDGLVHGPQQLFDSLTSPVELADVSQTIAKVVLSDAKAWSGRPDRPSVSINLDACVLEQPEIVTSIQTMAADFGIDPAMICLEVTEKSLPKEASRLVEALIRLRMVGFRLSLDDYGMGASSFELLRLCPFSEIKVDRSIVEACISDNVTRKFLHAFAHLARDLELTSVAEGIETEQELAEVRAAGVDLVQGFLFSRPLPPSAIPAILDQSWMAGK